MKKFEFPKGLNFRYRIQAPSGRHANFRVIKIFINPEPGTPQTETIVNSAIDAVNKALQSQNYSREKAKEELELFVEGLYRSAGVKKFMIVENNENMRLLNEFWDEYRKQNLDTVMAPS